MGVQAGLEPQARRWPQFLAAALATLCAASSGTVLGWSSPSLPVLVQQQLRVHRDNASNAVNVTVVPAVLTEEQASWAGSLVPLGALLGSLPAGFLADALGRKPLLLALGLHFLLGWTLILSATMHRGVWLLFAGRALQGACCGAVTVVAPLYLEEVAEAAVRGCAGVLFDLATNGGVLAAYVAGALLSPAPLAAALAALPAVFLFAFAWMPESPVHLAAKGHDAAARRALTWLRAGQDVTEELGQMKELLRSTGRLQAAPRPAPEAAPDVERAEGRAGAGADPPQKRVSLPALLTPPPPPPDASADAAPGRKYSVNLCAAHTAHTIKGALSKAHDNAAFEDTELPRALRSALADDPAPPHASHPALAARSSAQPILPARPAAGWRAWAADLRPGTPASRALAVVFALMVIRPASGINAITFYTVSIFAEAGTSLSPNAAAVLIGALLVPCNVLASRLVDRVGRRALLLGSSAGVALCHALLVAHAALPDAPRWLPVLAVAVFTVAFCLGLGPLPWLIMSELLPLRHRRWAAGVAISVAWAGAFTVTKCFHSALRALGPVVVYAFFCACALAGLVFIALRLPETSGRSRAELQGTPEGPAPEGTATEGDPERGGK